MDIYSNDDLRKVVNDEIKKSGMTKTALSNKVGLTRQGLDKLLQKKSFSLDDANKLLNVINKNVTAKLDE